MPPHAEAIFAVNTIARVDYQWVKSMAHPLIIIPNLTVGPEAGLLTRLQLPNFTAVRHLKFVI